MRPYYQDDYVTLYHGDNREILPQLGSFDLLLTDPPYGIGRDGQKKSVRKAYDFKGWDRVRPEREIFQELIAKARKSIIWGGNYFTYALPPEMKWLVWDKGQRIAQSDGELAWTNIGGALRIYTLNRGAIQLDVAQHPTQKPVALMKWCISIAGQIDTILDPFAGSGTTGRAAKDLCKRCVLIEQDESYCEIAASRMSQEVFALA